MGLWVIIFISFESGSVLLRSPSPALIHIACFMHSYLTLLDVYDYLMVARYIAILFVWVRMCVMCVWMNRCVGIWWVNVVVLTGKRCWLSILVELHNYFLETKSYQECFTTIWNKLEFHYPFLSHLSISYFITRNIYLVLPGTRYVNNLRNNN